MCEPLSYPGPDQIVQIVQSWEKRYLVNWPKFREGVSSECSCPTLFAAAHWDKAEEERRNTLNLRISALLEPFQALSELPYIWFLQSNHNITPLHTHTHKHYRSWFPWLAEWKTGKVGLLRINIMIAYHHWLIPSQRNRGWRWPIWIWFFWAKTS